jgi:phenylacetic acid degradation operon negative regulatory protein
MRMNDVSAEPADVDLRPLSARSVVLSLLLGTHPPQLPVKDLIRYVEPFGVGGSTLRAALSRMTAAGDLRRTDDAVYGLSDRLLARQRRQDEAVRPRTRAWRGDWEMLVITATGRGPAARADLRTRLASLRLAELREGVWLRPANLARPLPDLADTAQSYTARPDRPAAGLAAELWPLATWSHTARALLARASESRLPADRFTVFAAAVRHLLADPVLPPELLPTDWPGDELRGAYAGYRAELREPTGYPAD